MLSIKLQDICLKYVHILYILISCIVKKYKKTEEKNRHIKKILLMSEKDDKEEKRIL